ncbi:unnamed protein product [Urochloa humidicola]
MPKLRLGRQPQGRRVPNESPQLELQRLGREPLQSDAQPSRPLDNLLQGTDEQEIRTILQTMKRDASPGPDGLNVAFYRAAWPWIAEDVMKLVTEFYNTGTPSLRTNQLPQGGQGVQQEVSSLITNQTPMQEIQRLITTLWFIWKARNELRLNRKKWSVPHVLHLITADIHNSQIFTHEHSAQPSQTTPAAMPSALHTNTLQISAGTKCYTDAAITPDVQRYNPRPAGLGILIQGSTDTLHRCTLIQAINETALDALQAEAYALTLASAVIKALQIQQVSYMTDSQILATNLQHEDPITNVADWRIRPLIADFIAHSEDSVFTCQKIPRSMNSTAHILASQARTQVQQLNCFFVCNNPLHSSDCAVITALQNVQWGTSRLISVTCL